MGKTTIVLATLIEGNKNSQRQKSVLESPMNSNCHNLLQRLLPCLRVKREVEKRVGC